MHVFFTEWPHFKGGTLKLESITEMPSIFYRRIAGLQVGTTSVQLGYALPGFVLSHR